MFIFRICWWNKIHKRKIKDALNDVVGKVFTRNPSRQVFTDKYGDTNQLILLMMFLPSKETVVYMAGGYGVQTIAESVGKSEDAKRIASKSVSAVERFLDSVAEKPKK